MKKQTALIGFCMAALIANAQIKVWPGGYTAVGFTNVAPFSGFRLHVTGHAVFSASTSTPTSSAYIRGLNAYSTSTTPDYTWWGNDQTGIFHPAGDVIGFTLGGTERMRLHSNGFLGIGTTSPSSTLSIGGSGNSNWKLYSYNSSSTTDSRGIHGQCIEPTGASNKGYGVLGETESGTGYAFGIYGKGYTASASASGRAYGIYGVAGNATSGYNYAVYGQIAGSNNGAGVYGTTGGDVSIPGTYAGYFDGNLRTTDATPEKPTDAYWTVVSDSRVKKDVTNFTDGLDVIRKIRPVHFKYKSIGGLPGDTASIGVLAQEVLDVAPYCVGKYRLALRPEETQGVSDAIVETIEVDSLGSIQIAELLSFNPNGLFFAMLNAIKQLDSTVAALQSVRLPATADSSLYKAGINTGNSLEHALQIEISNEAKAILYQNEPNPFSNSTVIRYYLPENITGGIFVVFYDVYGKEVSKVAISERGFGKIEANTENLAAGIYTYSLVVDQKPVDTKKMLRQK